MAFWVNKQVAVNTIKNIKTIYIFQYRSHHIGDEDKKNIKRTYITSSLRILYNMAEALPSFAPFSVHADGAVAQRWGKWISKLENLFVAMNISHKKRQRALLLHYAGDEVYDIFETLEGTGDDFETAKDKLTRYFEPKKNIAFSIYNFRQTKQEANETMDTYVTKLRQMAQKCEFTDVDSEIKHQIIQSCIDALLRWVCALDLTSSAGART